MRRMGCLIREPQYSRLVRKYKMTEPKIQLMAFDVDGTLARRDQSVCPDVIDAIRLAHSRGIRITIATGRNQAETMPVWNQLGLAGYDDPMIFVGGSIIARPSGETLWSDAFDAGLLAELADVLIAMGLSAVATTDPYHSNLAHVVLPGADYDFVNERFLAKLPDRRTQVIDRFDAACPPVLRMLAFIPPERGDEICAVLNAQFAPAVNLHPIYVPTYDVTVIEFFTGSVCKWNAITRLAAMHKINPARIAVFGDDVNDITMLTSAGHGVAMARGAKEAHAAADEIATNGLASAVLAAIKLQ